MCGLGLRPPEFWALSLFEWNAISQLTHTDERMSRGDLNDLLSMCMRHEK